MQVSARTHSIGSPQAWRRFSDRNAAVARAIAITCPSSDSRTPPYRPSIVGRMPIFGSEPRSRFTGGFVFIFAMLAIREPSFPVRVSRHPGLEPAPLLRLAPCQDVLPLSRQPPFPLE